MTIKQDNSCEASNNRGLLKCPDGSRPRVLLAEDSTAARILTTALLTRMGCDVDSAENGEDAVVHASDHRYDVIIMDIEMPIMDGVTAAQEIRAMDGESSRTPIVALSAFLADSRKSSIWRESFDINMAKPADREQLRQVIQAVIDISSDVPAQSADVAEHSHPAEGLIDQSAILRLREEMTNEALQELFQVVIGEIQDCARLLEEDRSNRDAERIAKVAHKLKGIASTFAASRLEKLAMELEDDATNVSPIELVERVTETCACADETAAALQAVRAA